MNKIKDLIQRVIFHLSGYIVTHHIILYHLRNILVFSKLKNKVIFWSLVTKFTIWFCCFSIPLLCTVGICRVVMSLCWVLSCCLTVELSLLPPLGCALNCFLLFPTFTHYFSCFFLLLPVESFELGWKVCNSFHRPWEYFEEILDLNFSR